MASKKTLTCGPAIGYRRDIGWKPDGKGGYTQHRFYLGRDRAQAEIRSVRLERCWVCVEHRTLVGRALWDETTLQIAQALARGEAVVRLMPPARTEKQRQQDAYEADAAGYSPLKVEAIEVDVWLQALQREFPLIRIELADDQSESEGTDGH